MTFTFDLYQTTALAVAALALGSLIRKKISFFQRFCIPAPVIGGLIFSIFFCILYQAGVVELSFDDTMREFFMVLFFTSVGFQINLDLLKSGGKSLIIYLISMPLLIGSQNIIAIGVSKLLNVSPLLGMCTGSISMVGGHGTSAAFGPILEGLQLQGATTFCTAAATYGLIAGGLLGGPLADSLIKKHHLDQTPSEGKNEVIITEDKKKEPQLSLYAPALYQLLIAVGLGTVISWALSKTGLQFPIYIGGMIVAIIMKSVGDFSGKVTIYSEEINHMGGISLNLFLGIAMISLKLWQLIDLAIPLIILLVIQTIFILIYLRLVLFNLMGRDYDAAVICAGTCGFGLGATPNAVANMQSVCEKYKPSVKAFLLVPIVGGFLNDFINSLMITLFINII